MGEQRLGRRGARRPARVGTRGGGAQAQREREPARPARDRGRAAVAAEALAGEQRARLDGGEHVERELERERLPAALEPAGLGRVAAGDHHERVLGQRGEERPAQVAAERAHALVRVDQDQRAVALGAQRALDRVRDRRQVARVDRAGVEAGLLAAPPDLAQQDALADAARAVDEHHVGGRIGGEQRVDDPQLAGAAHEHRLLPVRETLSQRRVCVHARQECAGAAEIHGTHPGPGRY